MFQEWQGSPHARSGSSPVLAAMRTAVRAGGCDRCHQPLASYAVSRSAAGEGVTCDVCHTLKSVTIVPAGADEPEGPDFWLAVAEPVRYGPYCELEDHYFHRMGCSPLHRRSELCAACHQSRGDAGRYATYAEWRATRYATRGVQCQDCHMPATRAPIAEGGAVRERVADHAIAPRAGAGLALEVTARSEGEAIAVTAAVENRGAGHHLPTGSPDRRLVLLARALDPSGREVALAEASFGRVLLDRAGRVAPHHAEGTRAGEDSRIPAGGRAVRVLRLSPAPPEGRLRIELVRRPLDPAIASAVGVPAPPDQRVLTAELPYRAGSRARDLARRVRGQP